MTADHDTPRGSDLSAIVDAELERLLRVKAALNEGKEFIKAGTWAIVDMSKRPNQLTEEGRAAIAAAQRARHRTKKRKQRTKDDASASEPSSSPQP